MKSIPHVVVHGELVKVRLPSKGEKLSDAQIADLTQWIKMGVPDPRSGKVSKLTGLNDKSRAHWAYQPVKKPAVTHFATQLFDAGEKFFTIATDPTEKPGALATVIAFTHHR